MVIGRGAMKPTGTVFRLLGAAGVVAVLGAVCVVWGRAVETATPVPDPMARTGEGETAVGADQGRAAFDA